MGCSTSIRFDILTALPDFFVSPLRVGVIGRAIAAGRIEVAIRDLRDFTTDRHRKVDDIPYGGGGGMVLKPEPVIRAVESIRNEPGGGLRAVLLSPQGRRFDQEVAGEMLGHRRILLICGRYEGIDERVREGWVDEEISVGDYVLSGGEAAALVLIESIGRLVPGVLGNEESAGRDSFRGGLLDAPRYTRPAEYRGMKVPEVLRSGHHGKIESWKRYRAADNTARKRPDLLHKGAGAGGGTGESGDGPVRATRRHGE